MRVLFSPQGSVLVPITAGPTLQAVRGVVIHTLKSYFGGFLKKLYWKFSFSLKEHEYFLVQMTEPSPPSASPRFVFSGSVQETSHSRLLPSTIEPSGQSASGWQHFSPQMCSTQKQTNKQMLIIIILVRGTRL